MKKYIVFAVVFMLALSLCCCKSENSADKSSSAVTSSSEAKKSSSDEKTESQSSSGMPAGSFAKGIWVVNDKGIEKGVYYFNDTLKECSYHTSRGGTGIPFDYEISPDKYIFHLGSADNNTEVRVTFGAENRATLYYVEENRTEELVYVKDISFEEFSKSTEELDLN